MARRLSDLGSLLASPLRQMERVAEAVADYLVPDPPAPAAAAAAATLPPRKRSPPNPARARAAPKAITKRRVVVKQEPSRDLPFRKTRGGYKVGFYNESHLCALAWQGTGSANDPITFDE